MSKTALTFERFVTDPNLLGGMEIYRKPDSWAAWFAIDKAIYGERLSAAEERVFCELTQRSRYNPPEGGWPEVVEITGRQCGKTRDAQRHIAYAAVKAKRDKHGDLHALGIAQDQRSSMRTLLQYVRAPFEEVPLLRQMKVNETATTIELDNRVTIAAYPCRLEAPRGLRAAIVVLDELAFYRTSENIPLDKELLRAVRPCLATTGGKLIAISSPYGQSGALYDLHSKYFAKDDADDVLVIQAKAPQLNPLLPSNYLERMRQDDPEAARAEIDGEFRAGLTLLFDPAVLAAAVDEGVILRTATTEGTRFAAYDSSGGRADAAALAIARREPNGTAVLECLQVWPAPHQPAAVIGEASRTLRSYGLRSVTGDKYAASFVEDAWRNEGCVYRAADADRSEIYLDFSSAVNSGRVRLLDHPQLLRELRGLERKRGATRDKVDHRPGAHDDCAIAAALACSRAVRMPQPINIGMARIEHLL